MNKNLFYITFFLLTLIIFSYFTPNKEQKEVGKREILSTTVMIDSLVKEIVKDEFTCKILMEGEIDPHSYQMRKGDKEKIQRAALIFGNGLSLEHNPSLLYQLQQQKTIFVGDNILKSHPELIISREKEVDPHIWMDLNLMRYVVDELTLSICEIDPENQTKYRQNSLILKAKMEALDQKILQLMESIPDENRYLVSSHDAFNYFVRRYFKADKEERLFSMQGLSPEAEISLKRIGMVTSFIKKHNVSAIFYESNLPKDALNKVIEICKGFNVQVSICKEPLYGDTLGGLSYLQMMEHNANVIAKNLKKEKNNG